MTQVGMVKPTTGAACILIILSLIFSASEPAAERREEAATKVALEWLALVDGRQYEASWNKAASLFKAQVGTSDWVKAASAVRNPLGSLIARRLVSATHTTSLPGAPDGEYVVIQFQTRFENKRQAVETVTPTLDKGRWRVSGYYIR